jgi:hypothetical protein
LSGEQFEEKFKSLLREKRKISVISRALGFLDNGKFNKQVFRNFDKILKEKNQKKGTLFDYWNHLNSGNWIEEGIWVFGRFLNGELLLFCFGLFPRFKKYN